MRLPPMNRLVPLLLSASLLACGGASRDATESTPAASTGNENPEGQASPRPIQGSPGPAPTTGGTQVPRQRWMEGMQQLLPQNFCGPQHYFRQCFHISEADCFEAAGRVTTECLSTFEATLPETLTLPQEGRHWGAIVGTCAGSRFDQQMAAHARDEERCQSASNWVP